MGMNGTRVTTLCPLLLLGDIPLEHFVDMIYVRKDRLFLLDQNRGVKFCEYKIIEKYGNRDSRAA